MSLSNADKCEKGVRAMTRTKKFSKLFHELKRCREDEQMQKIEEMNGLIDEMNGKEFESIFTIDLFNKIHQMIEKKTLPLENALMLLKHIGYCKELKIICLESFDDSLLSESMNKMIIDENEKKKEEMNEKRLIDLCECYLLLSRWPSSKMDSIYVPCLLKVALKKDETEEAQKEVEMALLALGNIGLWEMKRELYLKETSEIIEYHRELHNLTQLAYQSAWNFLIYRLFTDKSLEEVITNELHFVGEARREFEELSKCVDWKRKEERRKEVKEVKIIWRWLNVIDYYFFSCTLWNEELVGLVNCIVQVLLASRDNHKDICNGCLDILRNTAINRNVKIDCLLKNGAIGAVLEEIQQPTINDDLIRNCYYFFLNISERSKEKDVNETEGEKRKEMKRKIFERMEEEGYEDDIAGFHDVVSFLNENYYFQLSFNTSDYFVNV
ncbi:uncharacterized protein MONOS_16457 [Monocercomonoides exilis]|uniref:uncharacterized protein n=1 Tax=Monocercomonoides exilis TaxID=2049356 RepID=UPI00355A1DD9|nr:hypothetical protein MONOS_16457 [Monocercomonoides exilis]